MKWKHSGGFSVNCDVGIDAEDRRGLERLLRYCARPAFADEFLGKIAQLTPKPRKHRHRYHGALAANSLFRKHIIRYAGKPLPKILGENNIKETLKKKIKKTTVKVRHTWARLITRLYELIPLVCPAHRLYFGFAQGAAHTVSQK